MANDKDKVTECGRTVAQGERCDITMFIYLGKYGRMCFQIPTLSPEMNPGLGHI